MSGFSEPVSKTSTFVKSGHGPGRHGTASCPIFQSEEKRQVNARLLPVSADAFSDSGEARKHGQEAGPGAWKSVGQLVQGVLERVQKNV